MIPAANSSLCVILRLSGTCTGSARSRHTPLLRLNLSPERKKANPKPDLHRRSQRKWRVGQKASSSKKESFRISFQDMGPSEEEDRKESAAAGADFFLFEKKQMGDFDPSVTTEQFKITEQVTSATSGLFAAYTGDSSSLSAVDEEG